MKNWFTESAVLKAVRAQRRGAAILAISVFGAAVVWVVTARNSYRSEGRLLVRLGRENVMLDPTANLGQGSITAVPTARDGEMYTVVETLRSTQLFERLVDAVGAEAVLADQSGLLASLRPPGADRASAVKRLERMIGVEPLRKSNLIAVACTAHDPELAQRIVAKYVELCMAHHRSLYRNPGAVEFFTEQSKLLGDKLRGTEDQIVEIKGRVGVTSIEEEQRLLLARASALEEDLQKTQQSIASGRVEIEAMRKQLAALPPKIVVEQSTGHPQLATDAMREQLYALETEEKGLQAELTEEHFRLRQVRDKLADMRKIFEQQQAQRTQTTEGPNRAFEQVKGSLLARESEVAALEERRRVTEPQLAEIRQRLDALNRAEVQLANLERDRELQQADYLKYARSLEQVRIDQALEAEHISNLGIAQPPSVDRTPVGPNRVLILAMAAIMAVTAGIGYALAAEGRLFDESLPPAPVVVAGAPRDGEAEESEHTEPSADDDLIDTQPEAESSNPRRSGYAAAAAPRYLPLTGTNDPLPPPAATF